MKILFWLLAILSLPVGWFLSYTSYLMNGLSLPGTINAVEYNVYYLRAGAGENDSYEVEIAGTNSAWVIEPAAKENTFDFNAREGTMDPAGRMTVALIPFSRCK